MIPRGVRRACHSGMVRKHQTPESRDFRVRCFASPRNDSVDFVVPSIRLRRRRYRGAPARNRSRRRALSECQPWTYCSRRARLEFVAAHGAGGEAAVEDGGDPCPSSIPATPAGDQHRPSSRRLCIHRADHLDRGTSTVRASACQPSPAYFRSLAKAEQRRLVEAGRAS